MKAPQGTGNKGPLPFLGASCWGSALPLLRPQEDFILQGAAFLHGVFMDLQVCVYADRYICMFQVRTGPLGEFLLKCSHIPLHSCLLGPRRSHVALGLLKLQVHTCRKVVTIPWGGTPYSEQERSSTEQGQSGSRWHQSCRESCALVM